MILKSGGISYKIPSNVFHYSDISSGTNKFGAFIVCYKLVCTVGVGYLRKSSYFVYCKYFIVLECLWSGIIKAGVVNNVESTITVNFIFPLLFDVLIGQTHFNLWKICVYLFLLEAQAIHTIR